MGAIERVTPVYGGWKTGANSLVPEQANELHTGMVGRSDRAPVRAPGPPFSCEQGRSAHASGLWTVYISGCSSR